MGIETNKQSCNITSGLLFDSRLISILRPLSLLSLVHSSLPNNAKLTKCLRIITYVLTQARTLSQAGSLEEKATLIRTAYDAYCRVIKFYSVTVQEELFVVAFFSYSGESRDHLISHFDLPRFDLTVFFLSVFRFASLQKCFATRLRRWI